MDNMIQYTDTAYTLAKKNGLKPPDPALWKGAQRTLRAIPLPNGIFCGDFRYNIIGRHIRALKLGKNPQETLTELRIGVGRNPLVNVMLLRVLAAIFAVAGLAPGIAGIMIGGSKFSDFSLFFWGGGAFIFFHLLTKIVPDKNNITVNRATGMISFPKIGRRPAQELPFAEFDAYYFSSTYPTGVVHYILSVCHRYSPAFTHQGNSVRIKEIFMEWEFLQQLMDVNLPLPDIPRFEPLRHLDPTTKAWDEEHGRDPNYWKNYDLRNLKAEQTASSRKQDSIDWHSLPTDHVPPETKARASRMAQLFKE